MSHAWLTALHTAGVEHTQARERRESAQQGQHVCAQQARERRESALLLGSKGNMLGSTQTTTHISASPRAAGDGGPPAEDVGQL